MRRYPRLTAVLLVGLLAAAAILGLRWRLEAQGRTVDVILDGEAWRELAVREGTSPAGLLAELRAQGARSLALYEATLRRLRDRGDLYYASGSALLAASRAGTVPAAFRPVLATGRLRRDAVYVVPAPPLAGWVEAGLRGVLGAGRVRRTGGLLEVLGTESDLEEVGLGFHPDEVAAARARGFDLVLRVRNYRGLTAEGLAGKLRRLAAVGQGRTVVFEGADVLGYERLIPEAAAGLRALGHRVGRIEVFTVRRRQRGEDRLTALMQPAVLRLFSVTPEELATLAPPAARDKYVRAALERHIRLLYLRPFTATPAGVDALEVNRAFVGDLVRELRARGFRVDRPAPLPPVRYPRVLLLLVAAGACALGAVLLGEGLRVSGLPVREGPLLGLVAAGVVATAGLALLAPGLVTLWRKLLALGAAIAGATLAVFLPLQEEARGSPPAPGWLVARGWRVLWQATGVSIVAGGLVAGLLTAWPFMMAVEVFLGVKVAHVLPPALALGLLALAARPASSPLAAMRAAWAWLDRPLRLRTAAVALLVGVAAVILLARSGNFGLPVLALEERLRLLLEHALVARPRTKEFLVGHPALVLAGSAAALGLRGWVLPLAAVGAIGQAGIINSFSHLHTPLVIVLWRTLNALVLGSLLGGAAAFLLVGMGRRVGLLPSPPEPLPVRAAPPPAP